MSNRKEAIFAMLAAASIGALWGGPVPYYGARVSKILKLYFSIKQLKKSYLVSYFMPLR